jgi:hypothetical protein
MVGSESESEAVRRRMGDADESEQGRYEKRDATDRWEAAGVSQLPARRSTGQITHLLARQTLPLHLPLPHLGHTDPAFTRPIMRRGVVIGYVVVNLSARTSDRAIVRSPALPRCA